MTANIEDLVRRIAANEAERVMREHEAKHHGTPTSISTEKQDVYPDRCRVESRKGERCRYRQGHAQRHRYTGTYIPPHVAPPKQWEDIESFKVGRYEIRVGSPVNVPTFTRGHRLGWIVTKIHRRIGASDDLLNINVEIYQPGEHTRTVKASQVVYVRPSSKAGHQAIAAFQKRGL